MNILIMLGMFDRGGIESYTLSLCKNLINRGHNVIIVSPKGNLVKAVKEQGIRHYQLHISGLLGLPLMIYKLIWILKNEEIDIIHSNHAIATFVASISSIISGIPLVTTIHGITTVEFPIRYPVLPPFGHSFLVRNIKKIIAVSEEVKTHLTQNYGVPEIKICVIPNAIDTMHFCPSMDSKGMEDNLQLVSNTKRIVYISRLDRDKINSVMSLIKATPRILSECPDTEIIIVGEGSKSDEVSGLVKKTDQQLIHKSIFMAGAIRDVVNVLNIADIVVAVGRAALEAMACGKTVVLAGNTKFGGILTKENIDAAKYYNFSGRHGEEETDPIKIADACIKLLKGDKYREEMGKYYLEVVENEFNIKTMVDRIEQVYKEVLLYA